MKEIETSQLLENNFFYYSFQHSFFLRRIPIAIGIAKRRMFFTYTNLTNGNCPSKNYGF